MLNNILMIATGVNTVWNAINSVSIGNVNRKVNNQNKNLSHLNERVNTLDRDVKCIENEVWGNGSKPSLLNRAIQGSVNKSAALTQQAFINTMGVDPWYYQQVPQQPQVMPGVQAQQVQGVVQPQVMPGVQAQQVQVPQQPQVMPGVQVPQGVAQGAAPVTTNVTVAPPQSQQTAAQPPLTEEAVKAMITQIITNMAATQQPQQPAQTTNTKKQSKDYFFTRISTYEREQERGQEAPVTEICFLLKTKIINIHKE